MATYANVQIQHNVVGDPYTLIVVPKGPGKFDPQEGIMNQTFNYGDGTETYVGLTLTADQLVIDMLKSGSTDHNFRVRLTTDDTGIGVDKTIGDGMKLVGLYTDKLTFMDMNPIHHAEEIERHERKRKEKAAQLIFRILLSATPEMSCALFCLLGHSLFGRAPMKMGPISGRDMP